jgi:hypothetical protein
MAYNFLRGDRDQPFLLVGTRMEARLRDGKLVVQVTPTGPLAELQPAFDMELVPLTDTLLVGKPAIAPRWLPVVFYTLPDGSPYLHDGFRATPKVGESVASGG